MSSFKDFLRWYNKKDVMPTLEAMLKLIAFYHDKDIHIARRQEDENPNSIVNAETMKFLANSSYGYQNKDPRRHTVTKYLTDTKTHPAIDSKLLKKLGHVNNSL